VENKMARPLTLSAPAQELILAQLRSSSIPLSAYDILKKLSSIGIKSSPTVYRALDILVKNGSVHKINQLNAYVACSCEGHQNAVSALTICQDCKKVEELHEHDIIDHLEKLRQYSVNITHTAVVELPITCESCLEKND
jgi:Fur family transcriptional regulator, zinc uptake regulator